MAQGLKMGRLSGEDGVCSGVEDRIGSVKL
jgi:hypothetical protein